MMELTINGQVYQFHFGMGFLREVNKIVNAPVEGIPGMKKDCHSNLPPELLLSWTPEQLDYMHDIMYWENIIRHCKGARVLSIHEMESNEEVWNDWLKQENEYAISDRKAMEAGGGKYLNFISIVLQRL